jgi:hypothetical protein
MRERGLSLRFSSIANIAIPLDPRAASKQRKEDKRKAEDLARSLYNERRRGKRLEEKAGKQTKVFISESNLVWGLNNLPYHR